MSKIPRFSKAYNINEGREYYLDELVEKENAKEFKGIRPYLVCPDCKIAHLTYSHNGNLAYLKTKNNETHSSDCTYIQNMIENTILSELIDDPAKVKEVRNKMEYFAKSVFSEDKKNIEDKQLVLFDFYKPNDVSDVVNQKKTVKKKYIPKQVITHGVLVEDIGIYKFFYGEIYLLWYGNYNGIKKLLAFKNQNDKHSIFSITMSIKVGDYIEKIFPNNHDRKIRKAKVVFLSCLQKNKEYYNFHLKHSSYFYIFNQNT